MPATYHEVVILRLSWKDLVLLVDVRFVSALLLCRQFIALFEEAHLSIVAQLLGAAVQHQRGTTRSASRGRGSIRGTTRGVSTGRTTRGASRRRGTIRGGRARLKQVHRELSAEWTYKDEDDSTIETEETFVRNFMSQRFRSYENPVIACPNVDCTSRPLPPGKCRNAVLSLQLALFHCVEWLKQHINLKKLDMEPVSEETLHRFLGVLFYTHSTGVSLTKVLTTLTRLGRNPLSLASSTFIPTIPVSFAPTVHREVFDNDANVVITALHDTATGRNRETYFVPCLPCVLHSPTPDDHAR